MRSLLPPCLILLAITATAAGALPDIDSWRKESLAIATTGVANQWYFFPDNAKNPRILVKATGTGAAANHRILTGGPPTWTSGAGTQTPTLNKQGVIVPYENGSAFLIAPHNNELRLTFFNAAGERKFNELIDNTAPISSIGLSAAVDTGGGIHVAYLGRANTTSETLRYAFRSASGTWTRSTPRDLSTISQFIRETVVLPTGSGAAKIYASLKTGEVFSLLRVTVNNSNITANSAENLGNKIGQYIAGNRLGGVDRVYYFAETAQQGFWNLKQVGSNDPIQAIGICLPTSIICHPGPDGKQRIVWLDGKDSKIHYLKPAANPTTFPFDVIHPVTGTTGTAEVRGLHFDSAKKPYLLCRNSGSQGFIAFPNEDGDSNRNGRSDLLDVAFNSATEGIQILPPGPPIAGFPLSDNKFKFRIPTVGSTIANGAGELFSSSRGLTYSVETSTNAINWTELGASSPMFWLQHSISGTFPNEVKVFTGLYNEAIPAGPSKRFFRVKVSRNTSAY